MEQPEHYHSDEEDDEHSHSDEESISSTESAHEPHHPKSNNELKQHLFAVAIAILAAITTHTQLHGGYAEWKSQLRKDWNAILHSKRRSGDILPRASSTGGGAPHAAPAMNGIPSEMRQAVLKQALMNEEEGRSIIGHERANSFRRTANLEFCSTAKKFADGLLDGTNNLVDLDFILPLYPSVRVLHSYYLGDALGTDSSFVYDNDASFGSFDSDVILAEIDQAYEVDGDDDEGLSLERVRSIVESHLDEALVNDEHVCLLQQYTANKKHGRSIRGRTKAYNQPHVSTFYQMKDSFTSNALSTSGESKSNVEEASLTFTGFATKFINLSVQPLNLYWDGGQISTGPKAGQIHTAFVGTIPSMESIGTASFPGHTFFVTPTYDKEHMLQRWTVTEDDVILYYDPLGDLSTEDQQIEVQKLCDAGKWSLKQKFARDAWIVDRSFGRDYLIKTGKHWLSMFPQPIASHINAVVDRENSGQTTGLTMWSADYLGQVHTVETSQLYFTSVPNELPRLTKEDFYPDVEKQRRLEMKDYQSSQVKGKTLTSNSTMQMNLKVLSCAPRVIEVKKFLSPVEVQHLIDLASGAKGDVSMQTSTVMASGVKGSALKQDTRSSTGGWIHREQDVIVDGIFRRVADLLDVDESMMRDQRPPHLVGTEDSESLPTHDRIVEAMQLLRYSAGEQYTAHHDFTYPSIGNRYQPKRYATVLLYLTGEGDVIEDGVRRSKKSSTNADASDGLVGGETTFPRAITTEFHDGVKVQPQAGKAILFYNVLPDGNMDDLSQHSGGMVEAGVKYIANIWIWDPIIS